LAQNKGEDNMPRKDPHTGVMVMTTGEFWADMAKRNGTTPAEEMHSFYDDMEKDRLEYENRLRQPASALNFLLDSVKGWQDEDNPMLKPVAVLHVLSVEYHHSLKSSSTGMAAHCTKEDGSEGVLVAKVSDYAGSYIDPPDADGEVFWLEVADWWLWV
jgi:hypothetical protein